MLAVYTFVFGKVFNARWNGGGDSTTEFALILFAGLIVFNLFAECFNRAPGLILANANYVKKVVFPLELLPWVIMGSALFHVAISLFVWFIAFTIFVGVPHITAFMLPLVLLPFIMLTMGFTWLLASLGVFLRDIGQIIGIVTTAIMFLSPLFFPVSAMPEAYQSLLYLNPLTLPIEQLRDILIWGKQPDWESLLNYSGISLFIACLGFALFQKTRKGFADVI